MPRPSYSQQTRTVGNRKQIEIDKEEKEKQKEDTNEVKSGQVIASVITQSDETNVKNSESTQHDIDIAIQSLVAKEIATTSQKILIKNASLSSFEKESVFLPWEDKTRGFIDDKVKIIESGVPKIIQFARTNVNTFHWSEITERNFDINIIAKSRETFSPGLQRLNAIIKTESCAVDYEYRYDKLFRGNLGLNNIKTIVDGVVIDDTSFKSELYSGMVEAALILSKAGDFFYRPKKECFEQYRTLSDDQNLRRIGEIQLKDQLPHIYFGSRMHPYKWFRDVVDGAFDENDVSNIIVGKMDTGGHGQYRAYSIFGIVSDHIVTTLNYLFLTEWDRGKIRPSVYLNILEAMSPRRSTMRMIGSSDQFYEIQGINAIDGQAYILNFTLSAAFREKQLLKLYDRIQRLDLLDCVSIGTSMLQSQGLVSTRQQLSEMVSGTIRLFRGYNLELIYQRFVLERAHAFIEFDESERTMTLITAEDAVVHLICVFFDAVIFPNLFWSNVHHYAVILYNIFRILIPNEYTALIDRGFFGTGGSSGIFNVTKLEILSGRIPLIFQMQANLPRKVNRLMTLLKSVGESYSIRVFDILPDTCHVSSKKFYIPFKSSDDTLSYRPINGGEIGIQFGSIIQWILRDTVIGQNSVPKSKRNVIECYLRWIESVLITQEVWYGKEGRVIYEELANGPEIPYSSYEGNSCPVKKPMLCVCSLSNNESVLAVGSDCYHQLNFGLGMFFVLCCRSKLHEINQKGETISYKCLSPVDRYEQYHKDVRFCRQIGYVFGMIEEFASVGTSPATHPIRNISKMFGSDMTNAISKKLFEKLSGGFSLSEYVVGRNTEITSYFQNIDYRFVNLSVQFTYNKVTSEKNFNDESYNHGSRLELLSPEEIQKLGITSKLICEMNSPIHNLNVGFTYGLQHFSSLSLSNVHTYDVEVEYTSELFKYRQIDGRTMLVFHYDNSDYMISSSNFPKRICLTIHHPSMVTSEEWSFLQTTIIDSKWILKFPNIPFLAIIKPTTFEKWDRYIAFSEISEMMPGTIKIFIFLVNDNVQNVNNFMTYPSGYLQEICGIRGVIDKTYIYGDILSQINPSRDEIDVTQWCFGCNDPNIIPSYSDYVPKVNINELNFNNPIRVYATNAEFYKYPKVEHKPVN